MAEQKHTPGPWRIVKTDGFSGIVGNDNGDIVTPTGPRLSDARLIAAAPELLEALRGFANLAEYSDIVNSMATVLRPHERAGFVESFSKARAAIAKAEG
jgi:hypothetical protein